MAEQTEQDRTEQATPFKLEEARKKGMVARSTEVSVAIGLLAAVLCLAMFSSWMLRQTLQLERRTLLQAGQWNFDIPHTVHALALIGERGLYVLSPLLAILVLAALLGNFLQVGPVFSTEVLKPDFQRLNPAAGLRRIFSGRTLFELIKVLAKLLLFGLVTYLILKGLFARLPHFYRIPVAEYPGALRHEVLRLLGALAGTAVAIALADLVFSRWEFGRRMRMSRRELREELKRREGDPQIRSRRRAAMRELRKRAAALGRVKDADVLITNPTHYAVALKYRRGKAAAPEVIAKGSGNMAQAMRELAFRHRVRIISAPALARALFREVALGGMIPVQYYEAVGAILRQVYEARAREGGRK